MRPTSAGTIQSAIADVYTAAGGVEKVGRILGLSSSTVSYGTEVAEHRPGGLGVNYLDRLGQIKPEYARPIADHFAALAGCVVAELDGADAAGTLPERVAAMVKETSEAIIAVNSGASIDEKRRELLEARAVIDGELSRLNVEVIELRGAVS